MFKIVFIIQVRALTASQPANSSLDLPAVTVATQCPLSCVVIYQFRRCNVDQLCPACRQPCVQYITIIGPVLNRVVRYIIDPESDERLFHQHHPMQLGAWLRMYSSALLLDSVTTTFIQNPVCAGNSCTSVRKHPTRHSIGSVESRWSEADNTLANHLVETLCIKARKSQSELEVWTTRRARSALSPTAGW